MRESLQTLQVGGRRSWRGALQRATGVRKDALSGRTLERSARDGESPVRERRSSPGQDPEYHGTRGTLWEAGQTTAQG